MTLSIMTLSIMTLSIMTPFNSTQHAIKKLASQHNNTQYIVTQHK